MEDWFMRVEIFDVGHGHCTVITAPNGRRMMLDCGDRWGDDRFWTPSLHYLGQTIDLLGLLNLDEDHLSDFQGMMDDCKVSWLLTNPTIGAPEFAVLKSGGMGSGAKAFARWLNAPKGMSGAVQPDFGLVAIKWYYLRYLPGEANTTNDLSLVVIVQFGAFKIVFAGDLEVSGWRRMLANPEFRRDLLGTNVLVASHHGRESGCCTELFDWLRPEIVIISDDGRQYDSQDTDDWYRNRCIGAARIANPFERRYVLTTRKDGSMGIDANADGRWTLVPVTVRDWPRKPVPAPSLTFGLGGLAHRGLGDNVLAALFTPPPPPPPTNYLAGLGARPYLDDPLARALGLGAFLDPIPHKR
jgi:beta-lactamase superfamily II metal-dependent hydrolase